MSEINTFRGLILETWKVGWARWREGGGCGRTSNLPNGVGANELAVDLEGNVPSRQPGELSLTIEES